MNAIKAKAYTHFIGIDVSRNELDFAVMHGSDLLFHREIENTYEAALAFALELKQLPGFRISRALFCLEDTGMYANLLLRALRKLKVNVACESALRIHRTLGIVRGKSDKADAIRIAAYAYRHQMELVLQVERRPAIEQLAQLLTLRKRVQHLHIGLVMPLNERKAFTSQSEQQLLASLCKESAKALRADLKGVNQALLRLVRGDERLHRLAKLMISVPGMGTVTALQMLVCTNEFRSYRTAKKFACYAGVAPFPKESGLMECRTRVSPIANREMKALLHTCAMAAVRADLEIKAYFERKTKEEGKPKMKVYNAVRFKLISRIYACVERDCPFVQGYRRNAQPDPALVKVSTAKRQRSPILMIPMHF